MWISVVRTVLGTLISMVVITTAGYALSKEFRGRNGLMWIFVFTMLFSGGLIPSYILVSELGLKDTILVLILPGAFGAYNLILIMNFFKTIPKALEEAAFIDGASFFVIFSKIYLPLSLPASPPSDCSLWWDTGIPGSTACCICPPPTNTRWLPSCRRSWFRIRRRMSRSARPRRGIVGTEHKSRTNLYQHGADYRGISVPAKVFCQRNRAWGR